MTVRGEGSAAGKERLVSEATYLFLGKYAMKPTNIHSDWSSNTFSGLCIKLHYIYFIFVRHYNTLRCCWVTTLDSTVCWSTEVAIIMVKG